MINKQTFHDVYIAKLSGIAEYKNEKEMWREDSDDGKFTIEFIDDSISKVIVRLYHENGNKYWERNYADGKLHGKHIGWYEIGNKRWEENYVDGILQ